jgi:hypothetical protein
MARSRNQNPKPASAAASTSPVSASDKLEREEAARAYKKLMSGQTLLPHSRGDQDRGSNDASFLSTAETAQLP